MHTRPELAALRRDETAEALRRLGLGGSPVRHLGQPGGGIDEDVLTADLAARLTPGRWCLATWRGDGHPDHEAVGRAAAAACAATGARLLEYPIWTWHWAQPGDDRVPWQRARRLDLPATARDAKEPGGDLVAVHWRRPVAEHARSGDDVHDRLAATRGLDLTAQHVEADFLLEVYARVPPAARSVAEREGLC